MDEKTKKRIIHIRETTKVNKQHVENYKRTSEERHKRSRLQKEWEFYDNRSINYRKHIRW